MEIIRTDAVKGLHQRLQEVYKPYGQLSDSIKGRAEASQANHRESIVEILKGKHKLNEKQIDDLIGAWQKETMTP